MQAKQETALERNEKQKIAADLGISLQDLSLQPSDRDLVYFENPTKRRFVTHNLDAAAKSDSTKPHIKNDKSTKDATSLFIIDQAFESAESSPRHMTYRDFVKHKRMSRLSGRSSQRYSAML